MRMWGECTIWCREWACSARITLVGAVLMGRVARLHHSAFLFATCERNRSRARVTLTSSTAQTGSVGLMFTVFSRRKRLQNPIEAIKSVSSRISLSFARPHPSPAGDSKGGDPGFGRGICPCGFLDPPLPPTVSFLLDFHAWICSCTPRCCLCWSFQGESRILSRVTTPCARGIQSLTECLDPFLVPAAPLCFLPEYSGGAFGRLEVGGAMSISGGGGGLDPPLPCPTPPFSGACFPGVLEVCPGWCGPTSVDGSIRQHASPLLCTWFSEFLGRVRCCLPTSSRVECEIELGPSVCGMLYLSNPPHTAWG